jgi:hypothetical protein
MRKLTPADSDTARQPSVCCLGAGHAASAGAIPAGLTQLAAIIANARSRNEDIMNGNASAYT